MISGERTEAPPSLFTPFFEFAVELGGDSVADILYTDGETRSVNSGQGGTVAAGVRVQPLPTVPASAFASLGYKFVFTPAENSNVRLSRFPVEVGLRGAFGPGLWAEAAYVRHLSTTFHGDGFFADEDFESSNGATLAAGWKWIGLSYTTVQYTSERDGTEFDASNAGITLRATLGNGW